MKKAEQPKDLTAQIALNKKFCWEMAAICAVAIVYAQYTHKGGTLLLSCLGILFIAIIMLRPLLIDGVRRGWEWLGGQIGSVNSVLVLGLVYIFIVTPLAVIFRWSGRDALERNFNSNKNSYWKEPDMESSMENQF